MESQKGLVCEIIGKGLAELAKPEKLEGATIDYGTLNPFSCGLWAVSGGKATRIKEFYYDGRSNHRQLTDEEYCDRVEELVEGYEIKRAVIDPSAASLKNRRVELSFARQIARQKRETEAE